MKIRKIKKCEFCKKFKSTEEFATRVYDKFPHKEHLVRTREDDLYEKCMLCYKQLLMLSSAERRAKQKGMEFNLTIADIKIPTHCPVLGIKLKLNNEILSPDSPTLDRIDNNKGYVKGNVAIVSMRVNFIKSNSSFDELEKIYFFYRNLIDR